VENHAWLLYYFFEVALASCRIIKTDFVILCTPFQAV